MAFSLLCQMLFRILGLNVDGVAPLLALACTLFLAAWLFEDAPFSRPA